MISAVGFAETTPVLGEGPGIVASSDIFSSVELGTNAHPCGRSSATAQARKENTMPTKAPSSSNGPAAERMRCYRKRQHQVWSTFAFCYT
jgi:hypothetical protein